MKTQVLRICTVGVLMVAANGTHGATVPLTTNAAYTQNFDTLASSNTSSSVPVGWAFAESGSAANTTYTAGTGSSATGDTYSFGASGNSERAFGGLQSGTLIPTIGAFFTNNTGRNITELDIRYFGEQWRLGALNRIDRLDFQLAVGLAANPNLTTGTWVDQNQLDFAAPVTTGTVGALNGNDSPNRTSIAFKITGLTITPGSTFGIRWLDFNASGSDDGLGVDNFSLAPTVVPLPKAGWAGLALACAVTAHAVLARRRRTHLDTSW